MNVIDPFRSPSPPPYPPPRDDPWTRAGPDGRLPAPAPAPRPPLLVRHLLNPGSWLGTFVLAIAATAIRNHGIGDDAPILVCMIVFAVLAFLTVVTPSRPSRLRFTRGFGGDEIRIDRHRFVAEIAVVGLFFAGSSFFLCVASLALVVAILAGSTEIAGNLGLALLAGVAWTIFAILLSGSFRTYETIRFDREIVEHVRARGFLRRVRRWFVSETSGWRPVRVSMRGTAIRRDERGRLRFAPADGGPLDPFGIEFRDATGARVRIFETVPLAGDEASEVLAALSIHLPLPGSEGEIDRMTGEGIATMLEPMAPLAAFVAAVRGRTPPNPLDDPETRARLGPKGEWIGQVWTKWYGAPRNQSEPDASSAPSAPGGSSGPNENALDRTDRDREAVGRVLERTLGVSNAPPVEQSARVAFLRDLEGPVLILLLVGVLAGYAILRGGIPMPLYVSFVPTIALLVATDLGLRFVKRSERRRGIVRPPVGTWKDDIKALPAIPILLVVIGLPCALAWDLWFATIPSSKLGRFDVVRRHVIPLEDAGLMRVGPDGSVFRMTTPEVRRALGDAARGGASAGQRGERSELLWKTAPDGRHLWTATTRPTDARRIEPDASGGVAVIGSSEARFDAKGRETSYKPRA